jgi:hypothetical protein
MGISRVINRRTAVLGLLLVILATAGFGFAAVNTVAPSSAGDGAEDISGYAITNIDYVLDTNDPTLIDEVNFFLAGGTGAPNDVEVKLISTGSDWFTCTATPAGHPTTYNCDVDVVTTVTAADEFRVVAAQ